MHTNTLIAYFNSASGPVLEVSGVEAELMVSGGEAGGDGVVT
jgi:hypothetical protein